MANEIGVAQIVAGASVLATCASLWFNHAQRKRDNAKAERDFFESFNKRFDTLNDVLNDIPIDKPLLELGKTDQRAIQDYLNLCSEEYL